MTVATVPITVRYFAAAAAAAGVDTETLDLAKNSTIATLVEHLSDRDEELARVLKRCSYLLDGVAVRDMDKPVSTSQTVDVLPPFAGG
ncbi:MoaD/ThiS family protein [Mycolicibacterium fortuitum]|uniref:Molybdopterin synthase sulfur carrier subunit n=2 Tax=Mycolicibacterium fortuitum TaxID=1766 RepID=A0A378V2M3_MYCFO|nr:MoaD/ThiS family protein [Mycolicibacterium fortuitum]CRL80371.1 ThiS family protein [Mycolicibacter nonchromogenicus]AMD54079.1 molybdopterin synthase sulfur carrier subunit [Mycolicibacterium fortuitum subsp. fortuitum DSM 46621 = ATCC 6841 = JCM 6387]EJZ13560.1 ThiS family protein [Mycolicibacterium fortuitum subsp. fortuitum DSM 46621 = ATCC 6841 = JCM 6387]MBP3082321.1 MoaD/ThiS family protein [Mycolicibacterium fortuitum]MCA4721667.1 MoaD/ThiS family protein [Mycolicibacterium fortuit